MPTKPGRISQVAKIFNPGKEVTSGHRGVQRLHGEVSGDGTVRLDGIEAASITAGASRRCGHPGGRKNVNKGVKGEECRAAWEHQKANPDWNRTSKGTDRLARDEVGFMTRSQRTSMSGKGAGP